MNDDNKSGLFTMPYRKTAIYYEKSFVGDHIVYVQQSRFMSELESQVPSIFDPFADVSAKEMCVHVRVQQRRLAGRELPLKSAQVTELIYFNELFEKESWLSTFEWVAKLDKLFGKHGKKGLVALNLDFADIVTF